MNKPKKQNELPSILKLDQNSNKFTTIVYLTSFIHFAG